MRLPPARPLVGAGCWPPIDRLSQRTPSRPWRRSIWVSEFPEIATVTRTIRDREGKVYVDFLQNRRGQLLVAPFSVRPVPEAAVSTPLRWSEVTKKLDIRKHTIKTVPARMKRLKGGDPFVGVLKHRPDLIGALERLARR